MAAGLGFKTFSTGDVLTAADANGYLMQGVWVFANAAARSAAVTSPVEGNMSYLSDTNSTEYYSGSAWVAVDGSSGGMTLLSTTSLTGTSVTVSSISQSYVNLAIYLENITFNAAAALRVKLKNNNNTKISGVFGSTAASNAGGYVDFTNTTTQIETMSYWLDLFDYTTNYVGVSGGGYGGTTNQSSSFGGADQGTGGITNIVITTIAGTSTFSSGTCKIYGVK